MQIIDSFGDLAQHLGVGRHRTRVLSIANLFQRGGVRFDSEISNPNKNVFIVSNYSTTKKVTSIGQGRRFQNRIHLERFRA